MSKGKAEVSDTPTERIRIKRQTTIYKTLYRKLKEPTKIGSASEEWVVSSPLVAPVVLLLTSGQFLLHVTSDERTVPLPLVAPVVLLLRSGQFLLH
jgi:hypothetical protein